MKIEAFQALSADIDKLTPHLRIPLIVTADFGGS